MERGKYKKILFYFIITTIFSLLLTFSFYFFLDRYFKKNVFIEIKEPYIDQNFVFYNNGDEEEKQQNINFYKILDEAENILLSTNPFSEVYKLNLSNQDYKIQNEGFYDILDICKTVYYCSDKTFAPMVYTDTYEENINTTNFECLLINKKKIRKLYPKTKINLDQFIDAYCLTQIINSSKYLNNFYLQKNEEIFVFGDQNKFIKGWNLVKKIIVPQKMTLGEEKEIETENEKYLKNIDIQEIDKKIEALSFKKKDMYAKEQDKKFDFLAFAQKTNDSLDLLNVIALKYKILNAKQKKQDTHNKNNKRIISLKFKNIRNKAISVVEGKDINKIIKKQYALQGDNKKEKYYELKNYFVNARTKTYIEPIFIFGIVFADNNIFAKALMKSLANNNFESANEIINKLRYHDCQYFVLYIDEEGNINYENSKKLKVKKIEDIYEILFYE